MVSKIIHTERGKLVALTDIDRPPLPIGKELCPAVVPLDAAFVPLGWDGRADGEARRDTDRARQCDEVGMEIRAVPGKK